MSDFTFDGVSAPKEKPNDTSLSTKLYLAAWRWHFYAGLFVIPFLVMLATTGLLMVTANLVDDRYGVDRDIVADSGSVLSVIDQAKAALDAVPGDLSLYVAPTDADHASQFTVTTDTASVLVSVNPYTGEVIDTGEQASSLYGWSNDIHGTLLIGDTGDLLIELAAGLGIILVVTGIYLWWPRDGKSLSSSLIPSLSARGRLFWKELHSATGIWFGAILMVFLVSGLAWTNIWGGQFVQAWSTFPAEKWDNVPLSDSNHASLNHGPLEEVPWGLEQTQLPASGSDAGTEGVPAGEQVNLNSIVDLARSIGFGEQFRVNMPSGAEGVYTISKDSMDGDSPDPMSDRTVHVDRYTGNILAEVGYEDYSVAAKSMAVGIAFHMGDMGLWNAILNIVFCLAIIAMSVSGIVMWWIRRPSKAGRLAPPPMPRDMPLWKGAVLIALCLSLVFPLVGLTLAVGLALDLLLLSRSQWFRRMVKA